MLQENYTQNSKAEYSETQVTTDIAEPSRPDFEIEIELGHLKELILNSSRIPLTELTIVDEVLLLEQLQQIQNNLPIELATAIEIVNCRQEIIADAQGYACSIVKSAEEKADQIVRESAIVRQAELDGARIRLRTEQECEKLIQATQTEIEQLRQDALNECQAIQQDADSYADNVLQDLENRLQEMLRIVQNGRQQLGH